MTAATTMTEEERQERLRKLAERRSASARPGGRAPVATDAETTQPLDEQAERIRRLQERRGTSARAMADTQPIDVAPSGPDSGPVTFSTRQPDAPGKAKKTRRSHKAEASRIASAGAGIALTFSLMSSMAGADAGSTGQVPSTGGDSEAVVPVGVTVPPATAPTPSPLAAATPRGPVPVILTPIQVRTRVVSGGSTGGAAADGGNRPAAGGTVSTPQPAQAPPPPPPPPPPPTTQSSGSG